MVLLTLSAAFNLMPSFWEVSACVLFEGLLGGAVYGTMAAIIARSHPLIPHAMACSQRVCAHLQEQSASASGVFHGHSQCCRHVRHLIGESLVLTGN